MWTYGARYKKEEVMHKCTPPIDELNAILKTLLETKERTKLEDKMLKAITAQIKGLPKSAK